MTMRLKLLSCIGLLLCTLNPARAQELVAPVDFNPWLGQAAAQPAMKITALSLPFFDDFSQPGILPDPAKWVDATVYINNTMAFQPLTRGVATFDALNAKGGPYDSVVNFAVRYADSLTSLPIDLSLYTPADSIYLSFFYQPQGNGFAPEAQDSFMLYLRRLNGSWAKVWSTPGTTLHTFRQVMIPVTDPLFFHPDFQFRFVNKASININDDIWNLDYVRVDANRNINDTLVEDVAASTEPSSILNDYTAMPYRHFRADPLAELNTQHYFYLRNNNTTQRSVTYNYTAREVLSNTSLFTGTADNATIPGGAEMQFSFPMYPLNYTAPGQYSPVVVEHKYYATPQGGGDPIVNDTITRQHYFSDYLAYDDGTAEKSYFLNQFATLPAKLAVEFHLNEPDTLRGVAIYFGRQVPLGTNKFFSVAVWKDIAVNGGTDQQLYLQDLLFPSYADTVNHFWIYRFDSPVPMDAGTFYLGTIQPAASGSDSLYFGLDVNRIGGNHLYFDVNGFWEPSIISGAVMIRPMLGQQIFGTSVPATATELNDWTVYPNPVRDAAHIELKDGHDQRYQLLDLQGRVLQTGGAGERRVDMSNYSPGVYFIRILSEGSLSAPRKIIKL